MLLLETSLTANKSFSRLFVIRQDWLKKTNTKFLRG